MLVSATATSAERLLFTLSTKITLFNTIKITQLNEVCSQDAIKYLAQDPSVKVVQVAKQFGIL